jgi:RND family efflux transporter MFP subunit
MNDAAPDLTRLRIDRGGSGGARGGGGLVWLLLILVLLSFGAYASWKEGWLGIDERPVVRLARVIQRGEIVARSGVSANGYVVARRRAALSTDIQGRIVELLVEEGDRVEAGQLVARLDTRQLTAALARARAQQSQGEATRDKARLDFTRFDNLIKTGDANQSEHDAARAALDEADARVEALAAAVGEIAVMIDKSSVYAPFAGIITAKNAEVGEVVAALGASGPNARGAVATLVDFETLEVQVELAQTALSAARVGAPVVLYLDAWPDRSYRGEVRQIWPTANRQKATVEVRVSFLERDDRLLPELGVRAVFTEDDNVPTAEADAARVFVPTGAVSGPPDMYAVWVYADGVVRRRAIVVAGEAVGGQLPVAEGLDGTEQVVLSPAADFADGLAVRPAGQ